jgi:hypothetical protein
VGAVLLPPMDEQWLRDPEPARPVGLLVSCSGLCYPQGKPQNIVPKLKQDLPDALKVNWALWVPAQVCQLCVCGLQRVLAAASHVHVGMDRAARTPPPMVYVHAAHGNRTLACAKHTGTSPLQSLLLRGPGPLASRAVLSPCARPRSRCGDAGECDLAPPMVGIVGSGMGSPMRTCVA